MKILYKNDISVLSGTAIIEDASAYQTENLDDFAILGQSGSGQYEFNVICSEPFDSVVIAGLNAETVELYTNGEINGSYGFFTIQLPANVTSLAVSIRVTDKLFDGDMFVGRIMAGAGISLPSINDNVQVADYSDDIRQFSWTGQVYGSNRFHYRTIDVQCPVVEQDEKKILNKMFNDLGSYSRVAVWFDEECFTEAGLYGVVEEKSNTSWQLNEAHFWTVGLSFRGVK